MKLPNWFKVVWWLALISVLSWFLAKRYPDLTLGRAGPFEIIAFVVWVALLLAPLFSEVRLFGVTLKQEIEKLKEHINTQVSSLRADISNANDIRNSFAPQIYFPAPPPDSQLPALEKRIEAALDQLTHSLGANAEPPSERPEFTVDRDVEFLFATRYHMERELRRIARDRHLVEADRRPLASMQLMRALVTAEVIDPQLERAIRDVYSVCSPAVHGEPISAAQVAFVRDVAPRLIATLRSIP